MKLQPLRTHCPSTGTTMLAMGASSSGTQRSAEIVAVLPSSRVTVIHIVWVPFGKRVASSGNVNGMVDTVSL